MTNTNKRLDDLEKLLSQRTPSCTPALMQRINHGLWKVYDGEKAGEPLGEVEITDLDQLDPMIEQVYAEAAAAKAEAEAAARH